MAKVRTNKGGLLVRMWRRRLPSYTQADLACDVNDHFEEYGIRRKPINHVTISRIERGEINPDNELAAALAVVMAHLPEELIPAVESDVIAKLEAEQSDRARILIDPGDIDYARKQLGHICTSRLVGNPSQTVHIAADLNDWLFGKVRHSRDDSAYQELLQLRGRALLEQVIAYEDFLWSDEIVGVTAPIVKEIQRIIGECHDQELYAMTEKRLGDVYYIARDHHTSLRHYMNAREATKDIDLQFTATNGIAEAWAWLGEKSGFEKEETKFWQLYQEGRFSNLEMACSSIYSNARSQARFRLPRAFDTLEINREVYERLERAMGKVPIRAVQYLLGVFEVTYRLEPGNIRALEAHGLECRAMAEAFGFQRHARGVDWFLTKVLN